MRKLSPTRTVVALAVSAGLVGVLFLETRRPLRRTREPRLVRTIRNLAVAACSAATIAFLDRPVVVPAARMVERRQWGLLPHVPGPAALRTVLGLLLLDYSLYLWHVLLHRLPLLWRCHLVHHVDLDLDASTALRFHFSELAASVPWRLGQVFVLGIAPRTLSIWQRALFASVLFHHSNVRLPIRLERRLNRVIVTPRMHGIHHSIVPGETNSNWSSGLTLWDRLHGTARLDVPQEAITIGVPAYQQPADVGLGHMLALPFMRQREWQRLAADDRKEPRKAAAGELRCDAARR